MVLWPSLCTDSVTSSDDAGFSVRIHRPVAPSPHSAPPGRGSEVRPARCAVGSRADGTSEPRGLAVAMFALLCQTQCHTTTEKCHQLCSLKLLRWGRLWGRTEGGPAPRRPRAAPPRPRTRSSSPLTGFSSLHRSLTVVPRARVQSAYEAPTEGRGHGLVWLPKPQPALLLHACPRREEKKADIGGTQREAGPECCHSPPDRPHRPRAAAGGGLGEAVEEKWLPRPPRQSDVCHQTAPPPREPAFLPLEPFLCTQVAAQKTRGTGCERPCGSERSLGEQ